MYIATSYLIRSVGSMRKEVEQGQLARAGCEPWFVSATMNNKQETGSAATRRANFLVIACSLRPRVIGFLDLRNDNCFDTRSLKHLSRDFYVTPHEGHRLLSLRSIWSLC